MFAVVATRTDRFTHASGKFSNVNAGMSAATNDRNDGAAAPPDVAPANIVFAFAVLTPVPPLATANCPVHPNVCVDVADVIVTLVSLANVCVAAVNPPNDVMAAVKNVGEKYSNAVAPAFTRINWFAVPNAVNPVPPLATAIVVPVHVPDVIVPNVVMLVDPAHVDNAVFSTFANPTSVFVTTDHAGAADAVPVPVCDKNCFVVVILPANLAAAPPVVAYIVSPNVVIGLVKPVPDGAAHVPSARKKLVVPPPDAGAKPFNADVNVSNNAVACVAVRSSTLPVAAVVRPLNVAVATCANMALVTTLFAIVVAMDVVPDPVTFPVNVIVWFAVKYVDESKTHVFVPVPVYLKKPAVADNVGNATPRNPVVVNVGVMDVVPDAVPEMSPAAVHVIDWLAVKYVGVKYSNADAPAFTRIN